MKRQWMCALALAAALNFSTAEAAYTPPKVPEDIYQWVQSSERMNYFFNKKEMSYGVDANGHADLDTLIVPVVTTYAHVQIEDVRMKRSWRMESTDTLADLAGEASADVLDDGRRIAREGDCVGNAFENGREIADRDAFG